MYSVIRNKKYDYIGESYDTLYPNLHKYPATMLPQIGIDILRELNISKGKLLDPYCGSGSSFASALECGINEMVGYDINPLAVLVSKVKFTKLSIKKVLAFRQIIRDNIYDFIKKEQNFNKLKYPQITNIVFWFSKAVSDKLSIIKNFIDKIEDMKIRNFFLIPFSETVRDCSYTRNNEFKLFRMKPEDILHFNPDVISIYFKKLDDVIFNYKNYYLPKLKKNSIVKINYSKFSSTKEKFDVVLTSPPYGDSKTTVAYGQFSTLSNEWLGINYARKVDGMLMGGKKIKENIKDGVISSFIQKISECDKKRALEVSSYYNDLKDSIIDVANSVRNGGKAIYIVGNRTVKNVKLPTDPIYSRKV